jgi:glyoxylase-like metal-dependent hydrolase (beta-lactamase superfamily II)
MNLLTITYHSTNYYALEIKGGKLLVDCGWPGSMTEFTAVAKRKGLDLREIKFIFVTHFHMDHAGLAQELKNLGAKLIVMESQTDFIQPLNEYLKTKNVGHTEIRTSDNLPLTFSESKAFLHGLGLAGEIIPTPGHSPDHATLLLDDGSVFTGDLPPRFLLTEEQTEIKASWDTIDQHRITRLYPSHGG